MKGLQDQKIFSFVFFFFSHFPVRIVSYVFYTEVLF